MKYRLTEIGKREASLLIRKKSTYHSVSDKIVMTLLGGVNYDIDSLVSLLSGDISIKSNVTSGLIATELKYLMNKKHISQVDEKPIMPN